MMLTVYNFFQYIKEKLASKQEDDGFAFNATVMQQVNARVY